MSTRKRSNSPGLGGILRKKLSSEGIPPFELETPDGTVHALGDRKGGGGDDGGRAAFRLTLKNRRGVRALISMDEYALGSAFTDGDIDVSGDFLSALRLRRLATDRHPFRNVWRLVRPLLRGRASQSEVLTPKHYDRGNEFYFAFLDKRHRLYSQALYLDESESLESAARNKLDYVLDACRIGPGSRVLDVGAGWGSFASYAAARGADVTMLTVSKEQARHLAALASESDHAGSMRVARKDIFVFDEDDRYDAIVLLGVMEHLPDYRGVLRRFDRLLRPDGYVYMDFSALRKKYGGSSFTYRRVFEGNGTPVYVPGLIAAANESSFELVALHNDRHSYFLTLETWARNLERARERLVTEFGEETFRLYQLYLWTTAACMQDGDLESYRLVLQKSRSRPCVGIGLDTSFRRRSQARHAPMAEEVPTAAAT